MSHKSHVKVKNVWLEYLMEWFYYTVCEPSGDGASVICCGNPKETANYFIEWWKATYLQKAKNSGYKRDEFFHPRDEYNGTNGELIINYHDSNENYMVCNQVINLGHGDISFIIESDCETYDKKFIAVGVDK